jgi:alkanesulfonate monooxygenase SsuD/methylene tetrahydromethanopterin reductase-like flavin-dependent oxidoreductase (luciferase family)
MPRVTVLRCYPDGRQEYVVEDMELPPPPPPPPPPLEVRLAAILQEMASLLAQGASPQQLAQHLSEQAQQLLPTTKTQT